MIAIADFIQKDEPFPPEDLLLPSCDQILGTIHGSVQGQAGLDWEVWCKVLLPMADGL